MTDSFYNLDISDTSQVDELFKEVSKPTKKIDTLVNNAAVQVTKKVTDHTEEEWDRVFLNNVKPAFYITKVFYSLLKKSKGSVVNVSSVHAISTSKEISAYAASKGALMVLTRAMALDLAEDNIRVNAVLPGATDTHMLRSGLSQGHVKSGELQFKLKQLKGRHPLRRIGKPEEIAEAIYFLADNKRFSFITEQALVVDGGATARLSTE